MTEDGQIEWRRTLPDSCQLSPGLKKIVTPLLAGLLEADAEKIWTFDRFFKEVTDMLSRKIVNVFHVNEAHAIKIYILPDENYNHLQNYITEQTDIVPEKQVLLYKSDLFTEIVEENSRAGGYPKTSEEEPLFLFNKDNNNVTVLQEQKLPVFNDFGNVSVESDAAQAKNACSIGYLCKRRIEKCSLACKHFNNAVESFTQYIDKELKQLYQISQFLLEKTAIHRKTEQFLQACQSLPNHKPPTATSGKEELKRLSEGFVAETSKKIMQLHQAHVINCNLKSEWDTSRRSLECPSKKRAPERAATEVERLRDSWQHLVRDRATRTLSYNDEQFHILERIKITHTIKRLRVLLQSEVVPQYRQLADNLGDWYKIGQTVYLQLMILMKDVANYDGNLRKFELEMFVKNEEYLEQVKKHYEQGGDVTTKKTRISNNKLKQCLRDYNKENGSVVQILRENGELVDKINQSLEKILENDD